MSVSITKYFSAEIDLGDVFRSSDDYRFCAAKNVGEFCEFDQSNGLFSYVLRADSEDDLEEAILDFLSTHEMCLLLKVYDTNGDIDGIDIAEIKDMVHIDYQNAWSDSGRNSVLKDGFINGFSKDLGHSMLGFNNGEHDLVVFCNNPENIKYCNNEKERSVFGKWSDKRVDSIKTLKGVERCISLVFHL